MGRLALRPGLRAYAHAPAGVEEAFDNTYAYSFDGANDYGYSGTTITGIPGSGGYTISVWVKKTDWAADSYARIVSLGAGATERIALQNAQAEEYFRKLRHIENTTTYQTPNGTMSAGYDGAWVHIAITSDSTTSADGDLITFYRDGVSVQTVNPTSGGLPGIDTVVIGRRYSVTQAFWPGWIDEVALYDTELTSGQIGDIYASGKAVDLKTLDSEPNLKNWWRFGDGGGDATQNGTIYDQAGSADITMAGFADAFGRVEDAPSA